MSVFIIDNELGSSVKELGSIIDGVQGNDEFSSSLAPSLQEQADGTITIANKAQVIDKVYEVSSPQYMKKLSDKEFESTFNLIIYVLHSLFDKDISQAVTKDNNVLIKNLVETSPPEQLSLRDRKSIKATSILSELTLIFNLLPGNSPTRVIIIQTIIDFFNHLQLDFKLLQGSFSGQLVDWLVQTNGITIDQVKHVFWQFVGLDKKSTKSSLVLINNFTKQYEILSLEELHQFIKFALSSDVVDLSFMINNNVSKALISHANDDLVQTFNKYLAGDLITSNPYQLPNLEFKSKMLSLCKFFENANKYEFNFSEIPAEYQPELEILLINCVKFKLIEGKVDQLNQKFNLTRVNKFILPQNSESINKNLSNIKTNLENWKQSLIDVNEVVQTFRENIK